MDTPDSAEILGPEGPLAQSMPGFRHRESQAAMAMEIQSVIENGGVFVAESGTGTGKTFAYLVPALRSGARVVVSTGTRHLQDQLFHRDLPAVSRALGVEPVVALLKGRSNYLCLERMNSRGEAAAAREPSLVADLAVVRQWATETVAGDVAEIADVHESSKIWPLVTSTPDNCLGSNCGSFSNCHVVKARKDALDADIVVINHHLFFADMVLREDGFGALLPGAKTIIFDEAHQLGDIATNFLGESVSSAQMQALIDDITEENLANGNVVAGLRSETQALTTAIQKFRLGLGKRPGRAPLDELEQRRGWQSNLEGLNTALTTLSDTLDGLSHLSDGFEQCLERVQDIYERVEKITARRSEDQVRWCEATERGFRLQSTPLDIGSELGRMFANPEIGWVFTSATLAVGDSFEHFATTVGLPEYHSARWESPFDYQRNALLYLPEHMPDPRSPDYADAFVEAAVPVLEASGGRAFALFTSYSALHSARAAFSDRLDYELLVQGTAPRSELLEQFRMGHRVVLLGTSSFWEGVDVRGEALSCVIIDKLPFESIADPLVKARMAHMESTGTNAFMGHQVPRAVMSLKQGAGRLIRAEDDCGVLMICDPRLTSKGYGRQFLKNLPPMPITRDIDRVRSHFDNAPGGSAA